jgi:excisionase family DNA binding protein
MSDEMLDVRQAAELVGRHPETVRRWVWSGRLAARREGNRLLVARADVLATAPREAATVGLGAWAERAGRVRGATATRRSRRSAADLVLEDRADRSSSSEARAGR